MVHEMLKITFTWSVEVVLQVAMHHSSTVHRKQTAFVSWHFGYRDEKSEVTKCVNLEIVLQVVLRGHGDIDELLCRKGSICSCM